MIYGASFLTDVFFAFFGFVTGRKFGEYPSGYPLIGGVLVIGGLLLLAVLASLLARKVKMPLPPEEREGGGACDDAPDGAGRDDGTGGDESGADDSGRDDESGGNDAESNAENGVTNKVGNNEEVPENRAPRGDSDSLTDDRSPGETKKEE